MDSVSYINCINSPLSRFRLLTNILPGLWGGGGGGSREAAHIRIHKSTLNRDGGRYQLQAVYNHLLNPTGNSRPNQQLIFLQLAPPIFGLKKVQPYGGLKVFLFYIFLIL